MSQLNHYPVILLSLFMSLSIAACGGSSDPFAAVPNESAAAEYSDSWDLTFTVTSADGCEDLDVVVGASASEQIDFSEWECDFDTASLTANVTASGNSSDDSYDLQCEAGGNILVAQYTASDSNGNCSGYYTITNTLTLADDGETLTGTQVADLTLSGCTLETDGIADLSCHTTSSITGERVSSSLDDNISIDPVATPTETEPTSDETDAEDTTDSSEDMGNENSDDSEETPESITDESEEAAEIDNDADDDGFDATTDCDDLHPTIYPGATELPDGIDNDCDGNPDEGLVTLTLDSLPSTVVAGETFDAQVTLTNNSGLSDFIMEARLHDTQTAGASPRTKSSLSPIITIDSLRLPGALTNFCTDANPCTTLASEPLTVANGQSSVYTFTGLVTANAAGTYDFVVRVMIEGHELVYSRAYQAVEVSAAAE